MVGLTMIEKILILFNPADDPMVDLPANVW